MNTKPESTSPNPIARFWREFISERVFEFEVTLAPEKCAEAIHQLKELAHEAPAHTKFYTCLYETTPIDANQYSFRITYKRNAWASITVVEGGIQRTGDVTRISGAGHLPKWEPVLMLVVLIVGILASLSIASTSDKTMWNSFLLVAAIFYMFLMILERNHLLDFMYSGLKQQVLQDETGKKQSQNDETKTQKHNA
jgi:hypothetical protein